jgi:4a-hydroxytetrahydrobiopterin dehydratase
MSDTEIKRFLVDLPGWNLAQQDGEQCLQRTYTFPNFTKALAFTQKVGQAADAEDHHPLICTEWGKVSVSWWTHKVHGLHLNDFVMAARTDQLYHQ